MNNLYQLLSANPDRRMRFSALDGSLVTKTFADVHADVVTLMSELRACGLGAGDLVGIAGPNSYDWVVADLALLGLACVSVALPVETGEVRAAPELAEKYQLSAVLLTQPVPGGGDLPPAAAVLSDRPVRLARREATDRRPALPPGVFTVAFSSGTSGSKKGLMMSKDGVANTIAVSGQSWRLTGEDDILIVMPFSNFQQRYLLYTAIWFGADVTVVAPERMFQKMKTLEPTVILGPPSFFEIVENRIRAAGVRDKLPYYLASALHMVLPDRIGRGLRAKLGRKWTGMYGSRVRLLFTGSAPVPPGMVKLCHQVGLPLFEVYGSTELGWIAVNLPGSYRVGTAGRAVAGVEISLAEDGEVLVGTQHPQSVGYVWEGEDSQQAVFLPDGRIATGDLATVDSAGYLRLIGRKKNVIITRSGVKINPEELEHDIEQGCRIEKAIVAAPEQSGLLNCIVWLDEWQSAERTSEIEQYITTSNARKDASHRIAQVIFRPAAELTVETGLLTRNFKVDRTAVMRKVFSLTTGRGQ